MRTRSGSDVSQESDARKVLALDPAEGFRQRFLLRRRVHLIGHRKQDAVLLGDMLAHQGHVLFGIPGETVHGGAVAAGELLGRLPYSGRELPSSLVIRQHHGDWASVFRQTARDHLREQHALFLAVMPAIGETPDEIGCIEKEAGAYGMSGSQARRSHLQSTENPLDHAVVVLEDVRRFNQDPSLAQETWKRGRESFSVDP